jgi:hypothetical protein
MKAIDPIRKLVAAMQTPKKRKPIRIIKVNAPIISREEALNKIFMVRYKMGHL